MDNEVDKKGIVVKNLFWRFSERVLAQLIAFIVSILIARILTPGEYGTVALITVFTSILQVFVDSGLGNALIQKKNTDNVDFSTVFFTNVLFCLFLYGILFIVSPYIAVFYNDHNMTAYIRVLGITVLISGIKNVQQAYVSKHMMFRKFFFSTLAGTIIAGFAGVEMAINGYGVWALIAQQVINLSIDTLILWLTVDWRPQFVFSVSRLKSLFAYGWKLLLSAIIDAIYREVWQLVIGKKYTKDDLAYYNQGDKFPKFIVVNLNTAIDSVLFPAMSGVQDEIDHLKSMTRRSIKCSLYVMAPLMIGLSIVGESLIKLVLTEKWLFAIPYMRIFCFSYLLYPISTANINAIKALGRSDIFLKLEIIKKVVGSIALLITMQISVKSMAYSVLITSVASQIINAWPNGKLLKYSCFEQITDFFPTLLLAVFMGWIIYPIKFLGFQEAYTMMLQVSVGAFVYIGLSKFFRFDSYNYLFSIMKRYLKR